MDDLASSYDSVVLSEQESSYPKLLIDVGFNPFPNPNAMTNQILHKLLELYVQAFSSDVVFFSFERTL